MKILVASHSHPQISKGGAEIAAHQLFSALNERPEHEAWFLGCAREHTNQKLGATLSQPWSEREYLYAAGSFDWFKFANGDPNFPREFRALLRRIEPDVVHFHHYLNFGVEAFHHVRSTVPQAKIVLTLHEYLAICHHYGQMITKNTHALCHESGPIRCSQCFKDIPPENFFLRHLYIKAFFDLVDQFLAPSAFLAERYIAWGLPRERVAVIENVTAAPMHSRRTGAEQREDNDFLRVGFFGQVSSLKGINVLFDAAQILDSQGVVNILFEIHGDPSGQPAELQAEFRERLELVGHNVKFRGAYDRQRVDALMQSVDVVLVPSIWWENSPVVVQEAFRNGRAVICSDIGGMAEKVRHGVDGLHFPVGNAVALASLLMKLAADPARVEALSSAVRVGCSVQESTDHHVDLYATPRHTYAGDQTEVAYHA